MKISNDTIGGNRTPRLVAQCLNQLRHRVPQLLYKYEEQMFDKMRARRLCRTSTGSADISLLIANLAEGTV